MSRCVFILLLLISTKSFTQDSAYLPMAHTVLEALKLKDINKLERYYFGTREIDTVIYYLSKEGYTAEQIHELLNQRKTKFKADFVEVIAETRVDWKSITLVEARLILGSSRPEQNAVTLGKLQMRIKDSRNEQFVLTLDECVYLNGAWWLEAEWMRLKLFSAEPGEDEGPIATYESQSPFESQDNQSNLQDTLIWFSNLKKGFDIAREKGNYAMVYYQPRQCTICSYSVSKLLNILKTYHGSFDLKGFNEKYTLIILNPEDTALLKNVGIKSFPGAAVFSADRKLLHYKYNMELDKLLMYFTYSVDNGNVLEKIDMQYFVNHSKDAVIKSNFDRSTILNYMIDYVKNEKIIRELNRAEEELERLRNPLPVMEPASPVVSVGDSSLVIMPAEDYEITKKKKSKKEKSKNAEPVKEQIVTIPPPALPAVADTTLPIYAEPAWTPDSTVSQFNFKVDTQFIIRALDSLAAKTPYADSLTAVTIINIYSITDEYYCPFFVSKYSSANDTTFVPSLSMEYLVKNFFSLNKIKLAKDGYGTYFYNVYEEISKRLNRFIRFNQTGNLNAIEAALKYQQSFLNTVSNLEQLEKPLFLTNMIQYSQVLNIDSLFARTAKPYLDKLVTAKSTLKTFINTLAVSIGKKYEKEMNYVVWNNSVETPSYKTGSGYKYYYPIYLTDKFGELLNGAAWYLYEQKTDSVSRKLAFKYVDASLQLAPLNPYYLDTRAHLQFVTGNKAGAIITQQKALAEAIKLQKDYLMEAEQVEMFRVELAKMKAGRG